MKKIARVLAVLVGCSAGAALSQEPCWASAPREGSVEVIIDRSGSVAAGASGQTAAHPVTALEGMIQVEETDTYFISEDLLNRYEPAELIEDEVSRQILLRRIRDAQKGGSGSVSPWSCDPYSLPESESFRTESIRDFVDRLSENQELVLGRVSDVAHGWSPYHQSTARAVEFEVTAVLEGSQLEVGERWRYVVAGGPLRIVDAWLCDRPVSGHHIPAAGDELLLAGYPRTEDVMVANYVYLLRGGVVLRQEHERIEDQAKEIELRLLREMLPQHDSSAKEQHR